ncbi:MAG: biotin/lipoyl-containing protein [Candidatus Villigracilaceae bacterium]
MIKYIATIGKKEYKIEIVDEHHVILGNHLYEIDLSPVSEQSVYSLLVDNKSYEIYTYPGENDSLHVFMLGRMYEVQVENEREKRLRAQAGNVIVTVGEFHLKAPMPGLVVSIPVEEGQTVEKGQILIILESMKMQNELKSPRAGKVSRIRVKPGESVEQHTTLLSVI